MNAITNCINADIRRYTTFKIKRGKGYYLHNKRFIKRELFEKMYPLPLVVKTDSKKGLNCDKTHDWLED